MNSALKREYFVIPKRGNPEEKREAFIQIARRKHGELYNYDRVVYVTSQANVLIGCNSHGFFLMTPNRHLSGQGCPECGKIRKLETFKKMKEECEQTVFDRAKEVHGDKYEYSKFEYVNINTKSTVICKEHGEFQQSMNKLIYRKQGCPECAKLKTISTFESDFMDILGELKLEYVHQHRFEYLVLPNRKYSYDFYLPVCNLLVELHGPQHYQKKFNMTEADLEDRKTKDLLKVEEAIDSGYNMLVVGRGFGGRDQMRSILTLVVQRLTKPGQLAEGSSVRYKPTVAETIGSSTVFVYERDEDEDIV